MSTEGQIVLTPLQSAYLRIFEELVPEAIEYFKAKSRDYQGTADGFLKLGSRAQFVQMDRKHVKLQQAVWEGKKLEGEQPEEIVMDQIGHCFLMLCCLRVERESQTVPNIFENIDKATDVDLDVLRGRVEGMRFVHAPGCGLDKDHYGSCRAL